MDNLLLEKIKNICINENFKEFKKIIKQEGKINNNNNIIKLLNLKSKQYKTLFKEIKEYFNIKNILHIYNMDKIKLKQLKTNDLINICSNLNIKLNKKYKKQDLINLIIENEENNKNENEENEENNGNEENNSSKEIKIGTLFSGIGAFEHALDRLNIKHKIVFACDIDSYVKKSYFGNYKITENEWFDDILKLDAKKYLNDDIDVIIGGSPCQSFSFVGKQKGLEDDRGNLIFEFIRIINESQPKMFIFENVKGLVTHDKGKTFEYVLEKFKELNYELKYDILKATDYNIPQSRQRLFLIGIRKNTSINIKFPPPKLELNLNLQDLLEDNVNTQYYLKEKGQNFAVQNKNITKKYTQINGNIALCQIKNQQFNWHGDFIFEYREIPEKYYLSDAVKSYVLKTGTKGFNAGKPETDLKIARPILSTVHKMHRAGTDNYITKYGKLRKLTPRECLRVMGFSDNFKIIVSDTRMYQQAGNSIVVNILIEILKNINNLY
jgi:DNA (cytosine-5)-methyltransferase 1